MRKLLLIIALVYLLGVLGGATLPTPADAAGLAPPVADCEQHGQLTRTYSAAELRQALSTMPAEVAEYTNCPDVIRQALLAKSHGLRGGGSGGGGGSFLPAWLIAVLAVLAVTAAGSAGLAVRNRRRPRRAGASRTHL
jgi:ABC-type phosphate transport system substrate-binding protein